ncbi:hypothetical protein CBM2609_U10078 [Cupriavidus taiwanensis]|nr:hypothetical protein CBM2604_U10015 [Cupriavidus taiwanensis]SOZ34482.1 hypothetical protein CBM2609_U10078 [Cupriavidus taiwanensis]SOZ52988.1 hypothetical protein CBM2610_U10016 [Cupriavidus taiwanensis]
MGCAICGGSRWGRIRPPNWHVEAAACRGHPLEFEAALWTDENGRRRRPSPTSNAAVPYDTLGRSSFMRRESSS